MCLLDLKDELLGLTEEPGGDPIYKKQSLDMDALYRAGEAQQAIRPGSIGIVYCIRPDNSLLLELIYLPSPWHCEPEEVEPVIPLRVGFYIVSYVIDCLLFLLSLLLD
ncbi:hypothetical protein GIB67_040140 [Kingdonia uniflora]|uniref:Uncharacterized protein n=1 Tax=Kingdonia uniflora TaxID=39325 RepID=A0A7J7MUR1_9MAGN|nr:hypothetical protein GIB67_040140 [Kingdonia uniflora]